MLRLSSTIKPRARRWYMLMAATAYLLSWAFLILFAHRWPIDHAHLWTTSLPWSIGSFICIAMIFALNVGAPALRRDLLDEAWLDGDDLLLRRGNQSLRAPVTDIGSMEAPGQNVVALTMRRPCILGDRVLFIAHLGAARELCAELRQRACLQPSEPVWQ